MYLEARNLLESTGLHENDAIRGTKCVYVWTPTGARVVVLGGPLLPLYGPVSTHKDGLVRGANPD